MAFGPLSNKVTLSNLPCLKLTPDDGIYTHAKEYWHGTYFVCADADSLRGVDWKDKLQLDIDGKPKEVTLKRLRYVGGLDDERDP